MTENNPLDRLDPTLATLARLRVLARRTRGGCEDCANNIKHVHELLDTGHKENA